MGAQRPNNVAKSMACRDRILTLCSVMLRGMAKRTGAMHVATVAKKYVTKDGVSRESVAYLLRRTYRDGGERQARDAGEPVSLAAGNTRSGAGLVDRPGIGCTRPGPGGDRFPPARSRRRGPRPSQGAWPARVARPSRAGPG